MKWEVGVFYIDSLPDENKYFYCCVVVALVCPIFSSMKNAGYGTHIQQYYWHVSGAYLTGLASGGVSL